MVGRNDVLGTEQQTGVEMGRQQQDMELERQQQGEGGKSYS